MVSHLALPAAVKWSGSTRGQGRWGAGRPARILYSNICSNTMDAMQTPSQPPPFPDVQAGGGPAPSAIEPGGTPQPAGPMKAMSPGVVDFLFRQLVAGRSAEDAQWRAEGIALSAQPAGAELARRLTETDPEALTPTELFEYIRAAQRLSAWAEGLRERALARYCQPRTADPVVPPRANRRLEGLAT